MLYTNMLENNLYFCFFIFIYFSDQRLNQVSIECFQKEYFGKSNFKMPRIDPFMPVYLVSVYFCISFCALTICFISFVAIFRTKRTPYSTKILAMGLLSLDCLFLISASVTKLFNYNDIFVLWHFARGCQIVAQMVVASMAFERLFVLNWPYVYLRVATKGSIRIVCIGIVLFCFLQYVLVRGLACYARKKATNCGRAYSIYFVLISILTLLVPTISYCKIYSIIRKTGQDQASRHTLLHYKGTIISFMYLINSAVTQAAGFGLSVFFVVRTAEGMKETGIVATLADFVNVINCIVDPLIYVVWFKETRREVVKFLKAVCP